MRFTLSILTLLIGTTLCFANENTSVFSKAPYAVCFTPAEHCTQLITQAIREAKESIHVQAYSFTSKPIVDALVDAKQRGVYVIVILDKSNTTHAYSLIDVLKENEIPVMIDNNVAIAHNKVIVIDSKTVITGSFNFTQASESHNAENVLLITDSNLAFSYLQNFKDRWTVSKKLSQFCDTSTRCKAGLVAEADSQSARGAPIKA